MVGMVALGYVMLLGGMAMFQREMIYHPGQDIGEPAASGVAEMSAVPLRTDDGLVVTGWYGPPASPGAATVVLFHGNSGTLADRAHKARAFLDAGYGVFLAGYRGFGGNPGRPSERGLYADARAAFTWLGTRGTAPERIVVYGESLGSGVAVQMACEKRVAALVLEAPFTLLPELAPPFVGTVLARILMADQFDNLSKISNVAAPILVIHGERDTVVPAEMGRRLLAAAGADKDAAFFPHAGHNDLWHFGAGERALAFLARVPH